ncbi:MAG TPA: dienelactone hydrolase family protein [Candidatus Sulfotelmatobacter sp.]|nr:dienelactone hydrolase family protein [Candidatus Sulfotelmatobacter sp.]
MSYLNQETNSPETKIETVKILSSENDYPAYAAAPKTALPLPAIVLIHSFKGLESGYKVMISKLATEGFVALAPEWQTFNQKPADNIIKQLVLDCIAYLRTRKDVNSEKLALTGFCAGGRFTMLLTPQIDEFKSAVAFYGFPYGKGFSNQFAPVEFIKLLKVPMLIIHGTKDQASNIQDVYKYAIELDKQGKYFEMKIYQGQPHGFMTDNGGKLSQSSAALDAYWQMVSFFKRTLT